MTTTEIKIPETFTWNQKYRNKCNLNHAVQRRFVAASWFGPGTIDGGLKTRLIRLAVCLLLIGLIPVPGRAEEESGGRTISAEVAYVADLLRNATGGIRKGSAYLQNVDATIEFDLGRVLKGGTGSLFAYLLWNDASTFSDRYPGDAQVVSNIDAERALRLYELWYEHRLANVLSLKVGLFDLNSEFDAVDASALFLNSSHGIIPTYSQTGENGPSIFPVTSLSARLQWEIGKNNLLRYSLLDAVPGDPENPAATTVKLSSREGVLHALEYNRNFSDALRLGLGAFSYSAEFDVIRKTNAGGNPVRRDGNAGWYGFAEGNVYSDTTHGRAASAFVRFGTASGALNPFDRYIGAGMMLSGFVPRRPDDQIGVSVAMARCGADFRAANNAGSHETAFEFTYVLPIADRLQIQPDLQYILNPGADPGLENALVLGVRLELNHGFHHR